MHRRGDPPVIETLKKFVDYTKEIFAILEFLLAMKKMHSKKTGENSAKESFLLLVKLNAPVLSQFNSDCLSLMCYWPAFKNRIFSKNDLIAPTNRGMNMVDLVGRRNATYIKHGAHVSICY
eukprot:Awhi_evm1s10952